MKEVLLDTILGGCIMGTVSYLSNIYGKESIYL